MAIKRQSIKVLRYWHRVSLRPEVQALSANARWWLYGVTLAWTGHNNGAIEFTRRRHAALYGLGHREVFERARRDVLATGLVTLTRQGGRNLPATYALANMPLQVAAGRPELGTLRAPMAAGILGASRVPMDQKTGASHAPSRDVTRPKETDLHIRTARASEYRKSKTKTPNTKSTTISDANAANSDARHEGEVKANGTSHASNQSALVSGSRH